MRAQAEQTDNAAVIYPRVDNTPSMIVDSITVYPFFDIPGEEGHYYGYKSYTTYQPYPGGYPYGLMMKITPAQKAAMEQSVVDHGAKQIGYYYKVNLKFYGSYTNGRIDFDTPKGKPSIELGAAGSKDIFVSSTLADPGLSLVGYFMYIYLGKQQGRIFTATALFNES